MPSPSFANRMQDIAETIVSDGVAPGAAISVVVDGEVVLDAGVGHRDIARSAPVDPTESALLYSVTKTLLAAASLRLVEQGRLALDDLVVDALANVPLDPRIQVRHLLNHTSGIPDYGGEAAYRCAVRDTPSEPWSEDAFLQWAFARASAFAPGDSWAYSNIGYLLVRRIIARHTGGMLQQAMDELVFHPAGVRDLRVAPDVEDTVDLMPGFTAALGDGEPVDMRGRYHPGWVSHGVVRGTAAGIARVVDAVLGGRVLAPESLVEMRAAVSVDVEHPVIRRPGYGLGLMIDRHPGSDGLAGHAGGGPGYGTAVFSVWPDGRPRATAAVIANRDGDETATRLAVALAREAAQEQ